MNVSELRPLLPNPVNPSAVVDDTLEASGSAAADFESFLTLLTAQLRNQDPLSPLDSTEFIAQLASFSAVEQQISTNDRLDKLLEQGVNGDVAAFASWIGRKVSTIDGNFRATGAEVPFRIADVPSADRAFAVVRDLSGTVLQRQEISPDSQTDHSWNGRADDGSVVSGRDLIIEVEYFRGGAIAETLPAFVSSTVNSILGTPDGVSLELEDGRFIAPESVSGLELG